MKKDSRTSPSRTPERKPSLSTKELAAIVREWPLEQSLDDYMIDVQQWIVAAVLDQEVEELCGKRHAHVPKSKRRYQRAGSYTGAVRIRSEWVPMEIPRVQNLRTGKAEPLKSYQRLRTLSEKQEMRLVSLVFRGLSQRNYKQVTLECAEGFGLSASTVSRIFQTRNKQILHDFEARDLSERRIVVVLMDATKIRNKHIMICVGVTETGTKIVLGFAELSTENAEAIEGLLARLIQRGLRYEQGLLFVVDGSKGIGHAITAVFGEYAHIQRCTQHKRENIKGHLHCENKKTSVARQLNKVYLGQYGYSQAKQELETIQEQLEKDGYMEAAKSLAEGMEDTLTLHRLGVQQNLRACLRTTNIMESLNAERYRKIRRWNHSEQCHRWVVLGLLEVENKMQTIPFTEELMELQKALMEQVSQVTNIHDSCHS